MNVLYPKRMLLLLALLYVLPASAQSPATYTSADIFLQLKKLKVLGSVLYFAAHPDDENTRLLAWLARERLYRTGYLSLTRGDGGQNLIGDEQGIELGLIRTQELLAARRTDGAEQFFSRAFDFGFSKSTDEALAKWGKEKILSDAVWIIRKFQPDIIITRFPEDSRAGHGHHSASAVVAHEAFRAAADPTRFPEQFKYGVKPWKVKRIFWNTFSFGNINTTSNDQMKIDVGGYNALVGKSYGEIAAESRSQHKSQGFGVPGSRGAQLEYFSFTDGEPAHDDLMDGVNTGWSRVEGGAAIDAMIDDILKNYSLSNPENSVPALVNLYKALSSLQDGYWKTQKQQEVQHLIEACSGLWMEATTGNELAVLGDSLKISISINNRLGITRGLSPGLYQGSDIKLNKITIDGFDTTLTITLDKNRNINLVMSIYVPNSRPISQPYWLEEKMSEGSFTVNNQQLIGKPQNDPAYQARFEMIIDGQTFTFDKPVQYKHTDPVKGELYQPLAVVPSATVTTDPSIVIFRKNEKESTNIDVTVTANKAFNDYKAKISKRLTYDNSTKTDSSFSLEPGMKRQYVFAINNGMLKDKEEDYAQAFVELHNGKQEQPAYLNMYTIAYDHIPHIHYFSQDGVKVLNMDIKTVGKKIGYIEGAGDKVINSLQQMGYEVTVLKERDITPFMLSQFDAVITGVRAFNVHEYLQGKHEALMEYVKNGGNFIVQYNTSFSAPAPKIGPYPFVVSRSRVTDEAAKVNFVLPEHPVLNYPNKITAKDFDNWIQERGIYFAEQIDASYETPLSMADPNEQEQKGSLIIASYGKGKFVYTGLVFFRELPAGVPGAYRLLANIIALNKKKGF